MIPAGVVRIISAIAPTAELRDAMLGDFVEQYDARRLRDGAASARAWCWREALRSLAGILYHSAPRPYTALTTVLPAVAWGYLVAACASLTLTFLVNTPVVRLVPVASSTAFMISLGPILSVGSLLGGYEAARAGRRAPLWSALVLGLVGAALYAHAHVWFWPALMLLVPACCLAGGVLQQAQAHRLAWEVARAD